MNLFPPIAYSLLISMALSSGCRQQSANTENLAVKAKEFKSDLIAAVSKAHRVEVVEHSWLYDFRDDRGELLKDPPAIIYKNVGLTPEQKTRFQATFEHMPDSAKTMFSSCMFEPHHSIELISDDGSKSVIRVCFSCGDTEWDGSDGIAPKEFQKVVQQFITPLGFQPRRNWRELAKHQAENDAALKERE